MQDYEVYFSPVDRVDAACRLPMPKIVLTDWMRDLLREKFDSEPLAVMPNGIDLGVFRTPPRGRNPIPMVGTVYSWARNKGTDICLRAIEIARRSIPELRFRVVSNGMPIPSLPLPPGTHFSARLRDAGLRDAYSSCDAWLFGTRQEGFGMPLLEAMACRTPVIATPGGAAPDIVPKGGGILIPHDDPEAMAREIVRVCTMPQSEWRDLSETARHVAEGFTWEEATLRFEQALEQAIAAHRMPVGAAA
jgi:glycosyltransferase involved in cell wall biosynthesis